MNSERSASQSSPFQEGYNAQRFFTGAGRGDLLNRILAAAAESVTFMTLSGDEGCGKTTMCRMVEASLSDELIPIYFPEALQSFEDLPRGIAKAMQIDIAEAAAAGDIRALLLEVWERLKERDQRIVLVFDQVEKIKSDVLDRIRKTMDMLNNTGIAFQILFVGNRGIRENLTAFSQCAFEGARERHFVLAPLDSSTTHSYLNFCINNGKTDLPDSVTPEMSDKIFKYAGGNIRMTNTLAEQTLQQLKDEPSFMVLLDNVKERPSAAGARRRRRSSPKHDNFLTSRKFLVPAGSCLVILIVILMIMQMVGSSSKTRKSELPVNSVQSTAGVKDIQPEPEGADHQTAKVDSAKGDKLPDGSEGKTPAEVEAEQQAVADVSSQPAAVPSEKQPDNQNVAESKPEKAAQNLSEEVQSRPVEEKKPLQKKSTAIIVKPLVPPPAAVSKASVQKKPSVPEKAAVPEKKVVAKQRVPAEKLFDSRVAASARWIIGEKKDHYTIQLMALASAGSENSIKKMLVQQQYQDIGGHLYILRRAGAPPMVLMFYGEYKTMEEAKRAKSALPPFLLKNNPYPVSVKTAVTKAAGN